MHNVLNSLAAVAVGLTLDIPFARIAEGLESFTGTGRRFERLGETPSGTLVIDDYAHHPTEIRATLAAARHAYPDRRIVAVFQPHLPSRTQDFKEQFAESFGDADFVVLTDIYLAREQPIEGVTGAGLAALTADRRGAEQCRAYVGDKSLLPGRLSDLVCGGDVLHHAGCGRHPHGRRGVPGPHACCRSSAGGRRHDPAQSGRADGRHQRRARRVSVYGTADTGRAWMTSLYRVTALDTADPVGSLHARCDRDHGAQVPRIGPMSP